MKKITLFLLSTLYSLYSVASYDSLLRKSLTKDVHIISNRLLLDFNQNNRDIIIIDKKTIQSLPVNSIQEVLSFCTGIDVRQRGPKGIQSDISINGGTFDQTLILLNGNKIIDPQTGHHLMNLPIPMESVERIEILKGASARRYGINSINGAINIITKSNNTTPNILLNISTGSNLKKDTSNNETYYSNHIALTSNFTIARSNNLLSFSRDQGNGYRYNTGFNNQKLLYQTDINIKHNESVHLLAAYVHNTFGANSFYAAPADKNATEKVETFLGIAEYTKVYKRFVFNPRFSYRYNFDDYIFIKQKPEVYRNNHYSNAFNLELNNSLQLRNGTIGLGFEWRNEKLSSNNLGKRERNNLGLNLEHSISLFDNKFDINSGVYFNYNDLFGYKILPGIDIAYQFIPSLRAYVSWGSGQRIPTYTDLYYKGPSNIGNENLIPELSYSEEMGLKFKRNNFESNLNIFHRTIHHFIDWTKVNLADPWQPSNFNNVQTWGWNIQNIYKHTSSKNNWRLDNVQISYTRLEPKVVQSESANFSRYVIESLRHQLITQVNFRLIKNTSISISNRYQYRINYKDYSITDFRLTSKLNRVELLFDINNLFDEQYEEIAAVPMMGRWISAGVGLKF